MSTSSSDLSGRKIRFVYVFGLAKPFLLKVAGLTEQEHERLYQQMQAEMLSSDFCGLWTYVTAWGEKPAEAQA